MSASKWPTGVDGFTDPSSSTPMNNSSQSHSAMHTLANDAVVALQQSVGVAGGIAGLGSATKRAPGGTNAPAISLDTAANWTAANPVLGASEVAVETDTGNVKVGNGTAAYAALGSVLSGIYARVFTPEAYGAKGDGVTDDTAAVNNAISAAQAVGGVVMFDAKTYLCLGAIVPVYTGPSTAPVQKPLRLTSRGQSGGWNGYWATSPLNGGTVLDLRYTGADGLHPAKIDTRGAGFLEIDHVALVSGGTDNFPFFQTTNTTVDIHHCSFIGNTANTQATCQQDAIILGGLTTTIGNAATAPFQGYGTLIRQNYFSHIRRGVLAQMYANGVEISRNTFSMTCGSNLANGAAIENNPQAAPPNSGVQIVRNLIESTGYKYGIYLDYAQYTQIDGNTFWDNNALLGTVYFASTNAKFNHIRPGYNYSSVPIAVEAVPGVNTWESNYYTQPAQTNYLEVFLNGIQTKAAYSQGAGTAELLFGGAASPPGLYIGSGSPLNVITAVPGSLYLNTAGGAGTTLYVKESATDKTGWVAK